MSRKKPDTFDLFNDDSLWGNQETDSLSHDDIMNKNWNHIDAARIKRDDPNWQKAQKQGMQEYLNRPDYVHPRGMLGKKGSQLQKDVLRERTLGKPMPLSANKKISKTTKGKTHSKKTIQKLSKALSGTTTSRRRSVYTPVKTFDSLNEAAEYFDVSPVSIKNWCLQKGTSILYSSVRKKLTDKGIELDENNYPVGFKFLDNGERLKAKKVHTTQGVFDNTIEASKHFKISSAGIGYRIKSDAWPDFYYIDENFTNEQGK